MGFPWQSARERWVLGIAIVVVITLLARWRGLPVTTILRRRLAMLRPSRGARRADESGTDVRTTALLRVTPPESGPDVLPLPLIASYADRYGLRADAIRVTSRDSDIRYRCARAGDLDRADIVGRRQPRGAAGPFAANSAARDRRGRSAPARRPPPRERVDGHHRRARRRSRALRAVCPRNLAWDLPGECGLCCGVPG